MTQPWSVYQKIKATVILTIFVCTCSGFIGYGFYQMSHRPDISLNRQTILGLLSEDPAFLRAVSQAAKEKICTNQNLHFQVKYLPPLRPAFIDGDNACVQFSTTHPSGQHAYVNLSHHSLSRDQIVNDKTKEFTIAQTDLITKKYAISRIQGERNRLPTTIYVIATNTGSWIIDYAPTSPTLDKKVESLALSFATDPHK